MAVGKVKTALREQILTRLDNRKVERTHPYAGSFCRIEGGLWGHIVPGIYICREHMFSG